MDTSNAGAGGGRRGEPVLDHRAIEAIARRVVELLQDAPGRATPRLVSAAEIARRFDVTRQWVYENGDRLGAVRLGNGARPRLRFDPRRVEAALAGADERGDPRPRGTTRRSNRVDPADLIPLRKL
jgi:hypothetical protein